MNWVSGPGWMMQSSGDYSITKHAQPNGGWFYVSYWKQHILAGSCESAEAAREICRKHSEGRN